MLSHKQIWGAIDALAARYGHSSSGLARAAGLDPTTFNKSKRLGPGGRLRWPSTESIAKILQVTGAGLDDFVSLVAKGNGAKATIKTIPFITMKDVQKRKLFDEEGLPLPKIWDKLPFPGVGQDDVFALEISNDSAAPMFRNGNVVIVSRSAEVRKGDCVVVKNSHDCSVMRVTRQSVKKVKLKPFNPAQKERELAREDVEWMARIVWSRH